MMLGGSDTAIRRNTGVPAVLWVAGLVLLPAVLAYALTTSNELQVTAAVIALLGVVSILARPYVGLMLFIGLLYIRPEEMFPAMAGMRLTLMIGLVTLVGTWFQLCLNRSPIVRTPVNPLIIGFGVIVVISGMTVGNLSEAAAEIGKLVILVLLILNLIRDRERYQSIVSTLLICTAYLSVYSIYLFYTGGAFVQDAGETVRAQGSGIFNDPNDLAATIVAGMALAVTRLSLSRGPTRLFYVALACIMLAAVLLTNSRGGMVSLLVLVMGAFLSFSKNKVKSIVLAVLTVFVVLAAGPGRMTTFDSEEESANQRFYFWNNGVNMLLDNPLTGVGFRQFGDHNNGATAHNSFVLCFGELGIPGYFCWIGIIYFCYRRRGESDKVDVEDPADVRELLGARLALSAYLAAAFFISRTYVAVPYLLMSLPLAKQISIASQPTLFALKGPEGLKTAGGILAVCVGSFLTIWLMADRLM